MFEYRVNLFKLFGFKVRIDMSWIIIFLLVTWSLAQGYFPVYYPGFSSTVYWWMGLVGALGLFGAIILHEFSHAMVARRLDLPMEGITLFIFGGVAEMREEPQSPRVEFLMAVAGPLSSIFLGYIFYRFSSMGENLGWPVYITGVLRYLGWINWVLAGFNLVPAFPLDGGRILRSALWYWKNNMQWATRISSHLGSGFGFFLSFLGILNIFNGAFISGLWFILIGMFLHNASKMSYKQLLVKKVLQGESVLRFMKKDPVTVPPHITISQFINDYIYHYYHKMYPVVQNDQLVGCVTNKDIKKIPQKEWATTIIEKILQPCSKNNTLNKDADAVQALSLMNKTGNGRLMVLDGQHLRGIITLKDLLRFLSLKLNLEGEEMENESFMKNYD